MTQKLTPQDIQRAALALKCEVASVRAVLDVEAAGSGFLEDGRVKVQYEPHVMYRQLKEKFGKETADMYLAKHPDLVSLEAGSYQSLDREDRDMNRAAQEIDRECALQSASWGMPQIMGYHWSTCGYPTLQRFLNTMYSGEGGQLDAMVKFIQADQKLVDAIRAKDWAAFARVYNGKGYAKNKYDIKLAAAYKKFS
jgi:hypothetical protein